MSGKSKAVRKSEMSGDLGLSEKCQEKWGMPIGKEYFYERFQEKF